MLGNDVVDLSLAQIESNWQRKGYLEKVFTKAEQKLIREAVHPAHQVWILWSMKEAAYKAENRISRERIYAPASLVCVEESGVQEYGSTADSSGIKWRTGYVSYQKRIFHTRSLLSADKIHTIAVLDKGQLHRVPLSIHIHHFDNSPSYLQEFNELSHTYRLEKDKSGLPAVRNLHTGIYHAASISHHGKYLSIIFSDSPLLKD
ncbi:4'-phosphopantetheinyl transferase superfamily protein [Pedobacter sp. AW31-3R]|uniref:4'-phosphopantetheinyl transferase superfamily protein n=1 Tax=Pedobacter sp. AW31-3R TaxID=3445781 RepID=UPI003F9F1F01